MASGKFVAYYRVSTARQGRSGLGLDAQRRTVSEFLNGGRWTLVAEYVEEESGRHNDRAKLREALADCRIHNATLIVAKFDRLSRNAAFLLALHDGAVKCVAADMPEANELTVGVMAVVAQYEASAISKRTTEALAAAKRRGVKLGNPAHLTDGARSKGRRASVAARRQRAATRDADLLPIMAKLRRGGATTLRALAEALNKHEPPYPTARGKRWTAAQVKRVLDRQAKTRP